MTIKTTLLGACRKAQEKKRILVDLKTLYSVCNVLAQHIGDSTKGMVTVFVIYQVSFYWGNMEIENIGEKTTE